MPDEIVKLLAAFVALVELVALRRKGKAYDSVMSARNEPGEQGPHAGGNAVALVELKSVLQRVHEAFEGEPCSPVYEPVGQL